MRTCSCRRCQSHFVIGHPAHQLHEQAREIAKSLATLFQRLTGRARIDAIEAQLVERYYKDDPRRLRTLPPRCPTCTAAGEADLPWWEPGVVVEG